MGEARRRQDRFEGPIHSVLPYRQVQSFLAFEINGDEPMPPAAIMHELACLIAFPDLKSDTEASSSFPRHDELAIAGADNLNDRIGDWAVVDPKSLFVVQVLAPEHFHSQYLPIAGRPGWYCPTGGAETLVGIRGVTFVREGGDEISEPVAFMRGHVRIGGSLAFRADESIALQTVRLTPELGLPGGRDHAGHIAVLANSIIVSNETDAGTLADAVFFQRAMRDPHAMLGDPLHAEAMHIHAHAALLKVSAELPVSEGLKSYCAALNAPLAIWTARPGDDPLAWSRFGEAFDALARAGHPVQESDRMWRTYARTNSKEGHALLKASQGFLDAGQHLAGGFLSSGTMRLVKVQDTTFLAFTDTDAFHEVIAWI